MRIALAFNRTRAYGRRFCEGVPASLKVGDTVTVNPYTNCGVCPSCRNLRANAIMGGTAKRFYIGDLHGVRD